MRSVLLVLLAVSAFVSCSPAKPSDSITHLRSIRYVRTRPQIAPAGNVALYYEIPFSDDPQGRSKMGMVSLRSVDGTTFVYDFASNFEIPIGKQCTFAVSDPAVSPYYVAAELYVNDVRLTPDGGPVNDFGRFRVDARGRVS